MAKPNSFNKRELEKKREQKRKEKQKRKEERKANNSSNGSFEDMIAYVDENGNITTTPVSPDKKQEVDAENIAVSTPKKEKVEDIILKGRVEHFNEGKGYGFIKDIDSTEKYFFHITDAFDTITEGMMVSFELEKGHRGLNAVRITLAN
jgi:cold shock CspA family protein